MLLNELFGLSRDERDEKEYDEKLRQQKVRNKSEEQAGAYAKKVMNKMYELLNLPSDWKDQGRNRKFGDKETWKELIKRLTPNDSVNKIKKFLKTLDPVLLQASADTRHEPDGLGNSEVDMMILRSFITLIKEEIERRGVSSIK